MGNGEQVGVQFAAILIRDTTGRTLFQLGRIRQPQRLHLHFLKGLMLYQMGGQTMNDLLYIPVAIGH
jgi:hypothetical protein